VVSYLRV